ncbi:MAG: hypothetical protein KAS32_14990 [Candidatus Peribacteraceae bacterium]|nr:hypothetical protein [Candidatus Peribacteraceae bacterium]
MKEVFEGIEARLEAEIKDEIRNRVDDVIRRMSTGDIVRSIVAKVFKSYSMSHDGEGNILIKIKVNQ